MGWVCDVPCGAGGLQPHPGGQDIQNIPKDIQRFVLEELQQPKEEEMDTVRQPRASHLTFGQFLIRIGTSIEPKKLFFNQNLYIYQAKKLCFAWFSTPRCSVGQANSVPVATLPPCRGPRCSQGLGWDPWGLAASG